MSNLDISTPIIVKVEYPSDSSVNMLRRITGFVKARGLINVITAENLDANPRHSKRSNITKDILETLQNNPEMMPFYSKGLLFGASDVVERDRNRYQLEFANREREGILDGGHNSLAIGLALLYEAGVDEKTVDKIRVWSDLKEVWMDNLPAIEKLKQQPANPTLDALVPVEILSPSENCPPTLFTDLILGICANRNQNAQLAAEAVANQAGVFDTLKLALPKELSEQVMWRTNDTGRLDPRFLVSLSWAVLSKVPTLRDYGVSPLPGTTAYSSKAEALSRFTTLMEAEGAARRTDNGTALEVVDPYLESAFEMIPQLLECYDLIYKGFRAAYNANSGSFGRISAVKKSSKAKNYTLFSREEVPHEVPPLGYMMPMIFGAQALVQENPKEQRLQWATDPVAFFSDSDNLKEIVSRLKPVIELADWDPQRVGKNAASYSTVLDSTSNLMYKAFFKAQMNGGSTP